MSPNLLQLTFLVLVLNQHVIKIHILRWSFGFNLCLFIDILPQKGEAEWRVQERHQSIAVLKSSLEHTSSVAIRTPFCFLEFMAFASIHWDLSSALTHPSLSMTITNSYQSVTCSQKFESTKTSFISYCIWPFQSKLFLKMLFLTYHFQIHSVTQKPCL